MKTLQILLKSLLFFSLILLPLQAEQKEQWDVLSFDTIDLYVAKTVGLAEAGACEKAFARLQAIIDYEPTGRDEGHWHTNYALLDTPGWNATVALARAYSIPIDPNTDWVTSAIHMEIHREVSIRGGFDADKQAVNTRYIKASMIADIKPVAEELIKSGCGFDGMFLIVKWAKENDYSFYWRAYNPFLLPGKVFHEALLDLGPSREKEHQAIFTQIIKEQDIKFEIFIYEVPEMWRLKTDFLDKIEQMHEPNIEIAHERVRREVANMASIDLYEVYDCPKETELTDYTQDLINYFSAKSIDVTFSDIPRCNPIPEG